MSIINTIALLAVMSTVGCAVETTSTESTDYEQVEGTARRAELAKAGVSAADPTERAAQAVVLQAHPASDTSGPVPDPWIGAGPVPDPWFPKAQRHTPPGDGDPNDAQPSSGGAGGSSSSSNNK